MGRDDGHTYEDTFQEMREYHKTKQSFALQVSDAGAIMVRPDGHVAWRALSPLQQSGHEPCLAQHASILQDALQNILRTSRGCAAGCD